MLSLDTNQLAVSIRQLAKSNALNTMALIVVEEMKNGALSVGDGTKLLDEIYSKAIRIGL